MSSKLFFSALLSLTVVASLSAQTPQTVQSAQVVELDIFNTVNLLEQNALLALLGIVLFMGVVWICYVWKECTQLKNLSRNTRKHSTALWILVAGISIFCGSCTVQQRAMVERYRAEEAGENSTCPMRYHYVNHVNAPYNNHYPRGDYSNWQDHGFCRHCGQRTFNGRH